MRTVKAVQSDIAKHKAEDDRLTQSLHITAQSGTGESQVSNTVPTLRKRKVVRERLEQLEEELKQVQQQGVK